jgi:CDP-paratose 2-epimerase
VRDVLHAKDLIALYDAAYQRRDKASGEIFNIGGGIGNSLSLLELLALLASQVGLERLKYERLPRRQSDQDFFVADIGKAARLLDWKPKVTSAAGTEAMLSWTRKIDV